MHPFTVNWKITNWKYVDILGLSALHIYLYICVSLCMYACTDGDLF